MIKFKGEILYSGPVASTHYQSNWCNSMCEYYPIFWVEYIADGKIQSKSLSIPNWNEGYEPKELEIILDETMLSEYNRICKEEADAIESQIVRVRKVVRIFKGRKYPIGTEGRVFWVGNSGYGTSVGIECANGRRIFVSIGNVIVIAQEAT
jgi:hypothetical protein